jgi:hypothetical protein
MDVPKLQKCVHRWFEFRRRLGLTAMDCRREQGTRIPVTLPSMSIGETEQERQTPENRQPEQ